MTRIFIKNLEFYAFHGVPDAEQEIGHRYRLSLDMIVLEEARETDDVGLTVDYGEVAKAALGVATGERYRTVERLAEAIGNEIFRRFPRVAQFELELGKRLPPAPIIAEEVGLRRTFKRA